MMYFYSILFLTYFYSIFLATKVSELIKVATSHCLQLEEFQFMADSVTAKRQPHKNKTLQKIFQLCHEEGLTPSNSNPQTANSKFRRIAIKLNLLFIAFQ